MYPKLRGDIYLAPVNPHQMLVAVDGKGHHMEGQSIYALTERLLPFLNGKHHLRDLVGHLSEDKARAVTGLIEGLHRLGAVRDHAANREIPLDEVTQQVYGRTLAFLETLTERAFEAFERFQNSKVVILGSGSAVRTLASALWESGLRYGTMVSRSEDPIRTLLERKWQTHTSQDPQSQWTFTDTMPEVPADLVILIGTPEEIHARLQDSKLRAARVLPLAVTRDFAVVGPVNVQWQEVLSRIHWEAPLPDTSTAYGVMGARTALEAFRLLCGLSSVTENQLLRICTSSLTDSNHPLVPQSLMDTVDAFSGFLASVEEEDLIQLPIKLVRVRFHSGETHVAAGLTTEQARVSGTLAGLAYTLPERDGWQVAWGRTQEEVQGMGLLAWAEQQAVQGSEVWRDAALHLSRNGSFWWKTLKMRHHLQPVVKVHTVQDIPVVEVLHGETLLGRAAGTTPGDALERALLSALAHVQSETSEPVLTVLMDNTNWTEFLQGHSVQVELAPALQTLKDRGAFVGWVKVR